MNDSSYNLAVLILSSGWVHSIRSVWVGPSLPPLCYATLLIVAASYFSIVLLFRHRDDVGVAAPRVLPLGLRAIFYSTTIIYLAIFHGAQTQSFVYFGF